MSIQISTVVALQEIAEEGFNGSGLHIHARRGDEGEAIAISPDGGLTVRFFKSGTATDVEMGVNVLLVGVD